jgi:hypothetical protein
MQRLSMARTSSARSPRASGVSRWASGAADRSVQAVGSVTRPAAARTDVDHACARTAPFEEHVEALAEERVEWMSDDE